MKQLTYIFTFLFSATLFAQVSFTTQVSKNNLGVNQRFKIQFSINKQGADNFSAPSFTNFKVVGGPSSSVNQSWINGKSSYTQSYIYILQPKRVGNFTIPSATIQYEGKTLKSNPVKIEVTKAVAIPKDPNNPEYVAQQNIHLVAEVSKTNPYIGEGIYVVYKLYVSDNISVYEWRNTETPQYNGFWNQEIEVKNVNVQRGKYNGKDYKYIVLKRAVLIPQRSGKLKIEPIKMDFSVGVPTGRGDWFGNMITKNIRYATQSAIRTVNVKALPELNKPEDFTGAVGDFDFKVTADKTTLKANEAAQIKVEVNGRGNLKLFEIPKITTPSELEVYTPEHKERVSTALNGLRGSITDTYTVVPQYKGKYKVPETSFSYFSVKEKQYKTITTPPIFVDVTEGKELPTTSANTTNKKPVVAEGTSFRYIATATTLEAESNSVFLGTKLFYILLLLPFIIIPIVILIAKQQEKRASDVFGNKIRLADKLAKKYLSEANKKLGNKEEFYIALEKALHNYLKAKLHIETSEISKEKIAEILTNKKVEATTIKEFITVLNDCDFARYTPTTDVMMKQELEKAKQVITQLDKQL